MRSIKKIAILLTLALILALVAACRGNGNENDETEPDTTPDSVVEQPSTTEPSGNDTTPTNEPESGLIRDIGRDIRIICWWQYMPNTTDDQPDPATSNNYMNDRAWRDNQMRVEEAYNVTFTNIVIPRPEIMEPLTASILAGDPMAEWVMLGSEHMITAIQGDIMLSADQFAAPDSDILNARTFVRPVVEFQDRIWAFGRTELQTQGSGLGVNLDIINAIGAPNPVELWSRGEWTWDAMREIMQLATRDTTGDGNMDQFGLSGNTDTIAFNLIATNNGRLVNPETMTYGFDHPNTLQALEFLYEIFSNRWWYYDALSGNPMGDWGRDHNAFWDGRSALFTTATWVFEGGNFPSFEHAVVPWPQGPSGQGYNRLGGFPQGMTIPTGSQNPHDLFMLYEEIQKWAAHDMDLMSFGAYDYTRRSWLTEEDVYRVLHHIGDPDRELFDIGLAIPDYPWVVMGFARHFFNGTMTVGQAVEAYRPPQQDLIDAIFGN